MILFNPIFVYPERGQKPLWVKGLLVMLAYRESFPWERLLGTWEPTIQGNVAQEEEEEEGEQSLTRASQSASENARTELFFPIFDIVHDGGHSMSTCTRILNLR